MDDGGSWYETLAKNGWLGTKAQVSAKYGSPAWSTKKPDPMSQALSNVKATAKKPDEEGAG